jgi:hypothetical protein
MTRSLVYADDTPPFASHPAAGLARALTSAERIAAHAFPNVRIAVGPPWRGRRVEACLGLMWPHLAPLAVQRRFAVGEAAAGP